MFGPIATSVVATQIATIHDEQSKARDRTVRRHLGARSSWRVCEVPGSSGPTYQGEGYYWTTKGGTRLRCSPAVYKWPCIYIASTRRIEVGRDWPGFAWRHTYGM
jgi:hypothetical protein